MQLEHEPAFVVVEYVLPATQGVHTLLDETVQAEETYVPALQTAQLEQAPALLVVEYVLPAAHPPHTMSAVTRQPVET